jgi:hypothetical protein
MQGQIEEAPNQKTYEIVSSQKHTEFEIEVWKGVETVRRGSPACSAFQRLEQFGNSPPTRLEGRSVPTSVR